MGQTAQQKAQEHAGKSRGGRQAQQSTALAAIKTKLEDRRVLAQIAGVVPHGLKQMVTPDLMLRTALSVVQGSAKLQQCDPLSIVSACVKAAQLGLIPDGMMGHAYLIPRRVKGQMQAHFQIGYKGIVHLLYRTDKCRVRGRCVWRNDKFVPVEGTSPGLIHEPGTDKHGLVVTSGEWKDLRAAYATALYPDGYKDYRVIDVPYIERVRSVSEAYRNAEQYKKHDSPWHLWPEAMVEKTAIVRLSKQLPLSTAAQQALSTDDAIAAGVKGYRYAMTDRGVIDVAFDVSPTTGMPTGLVPEVGAESGADMMTAPADESESESEPEQQRATNDAPEQEPPPHDDDDIPFGNNDDPEKNSAPPARAQPECSHPPAAIENDGRCGVCGEAQLEMPH